MTTLAVCGALAAFLSVCCTCPAQVLTGASCLGPDGKNLDLEHAPSTNLPYTVRSSKIDNPFDFLPWVRAQDRAAATAVSALVDRQPFSYAVAETKALDLIRNQGFFPQTSGFRVKFLLQTLSVSCSGTQVDLVYHVYTSQLAPGLGGTPEAQTTTQKTPQNTAGLTSNSPGPIPITLVPTLGFDSADKLYAGGQLDAGFCSQCSAPIQFTVQEQASQSMQTVHAALGTSQNSTGPLLRSDYRINYDISSLPTGAGALRQAQASLEYTATTRPFLQGNLSARFGGLIEKGDEQALQKAPASPVNALKLYGGINSLSAHNVVAVSFGAAFGTANLNDGVQWKKYIGDLHDDYWHTLGDHHTFDLDSRLTLGDIRRGTAIPVAERFFGGSHEQLFMPDNAWQIRANPVIRSIPGRRFYMTASGPGADRFVAAGFTAALSVWQKPLVPPEVSKNAQLMSLLNDQLGTATSVEQNNFATRDPHYLNIVAELPNIVTALQTLKEAAGTEPQFSACAGAVRMAMSRAKSAVSETGSQRYGEVVSLLPLSAPQGEDRLTKVIARCDPILDLTSITSETKKIEDDFNAIDSQAAESKATSEMLIVHHTLDTLFHDINLISISPVAVFDVAQIGPSAQGIGGTRFGPGAGLRLELASSVNFTVGYARNVNAGPGEGSGAFFFSMGLRDLFH